MTTFLFVLMLLAPGMSEPIVNKTPMATFEDCVASVAAQSTNVIKSEGKEYKVLVGCEISSTKSNPA